LPTVLAVGGSVSRERRAEMEALLLVAIKTDQPNIQRRLEIILAASAPVGEMPPAEVWAFELGHEEPAPHALTANAYEALVALIGQDGVDRLQIGSLCAERSDR
jgi:hypothetical protein